MNKTMAKNTTQPKEKKISSITIILIIQLVVMIALTLIMTKTSSTLTRQNALDHMATITDERAHIIEDFVVNAEKTLTAYSRAGQIKTLLLNPEDPEAQKAAQEYTEKFSADITGLEGIYASEWNTHVLTHTNPDTVGMITRKDPEPLKQLQDAMLAAGDGVYDTGIIMSPATGQQIVSMYKAVYDDNGNPIGLVGLGIYTEELIQNLDSLSIRGIDDSFYSMVNTANNAYIFHTDKTKITTETTNAKILNVIDQVKGKTANATGSFEYKDDNGKFISTYTYMADFGWILMLDAPKGEVYAMTIQMRIFIAIFGILIIGLILIFSFLNRRQEAINRKLTKQIDKTEKTKESLTTAMFKDILTDASNRVSFSMDLDKIVPNKDRPCYFVMFNISEFSAINTCYGNDAGDAVLVNTANALTNAFEDGTVYRTGSDEFVVAVQKSEDSTASYNEVCRQLNDAHGKLLSPQATPNGVINVIYKVAVVKKSDELSTAVVTALKDMTNQAGDAVYGKIQFMDMDAT